MVSRTGGGVRSEDRDAMGGAMEGEMDERQSTGRGREGLYGARKLTKVGLSEFEYERSEIFVCRIS